MWNIFICNVVAQPKKIKTVLRTSFGIFVLIPPRVTIEVTTIGPRNHARGISKKSANIKGIKNDVAGIADVL